MKLRACAVLLAALGLSTPVFAQSSTAAGTSGSTAAGTSGSQNIGASGVNETNGNSNPKNVKAQGSGTGNADVGSGPNAKSGKSAGTGGTGGTGGTTGSSTARSGTGGTSGTSGSNVGATGTNETAGPSHPQGVKPEGSGSADSGKRSGSAPKY